MTKGKSAVDETKDTPRLPVVKHGKVPNGEELVSVTVTKFGSGLVSTGVHVTGEGDIYAERGDKLKVSKNTAVSLETLGFAEID